MPEAKPVQNVLKIKSIGMKSEIQAILKGFSRSTPFRRTLFYFIARLIVRLEQLWFNV